MKKICVLRLGHRRVRDRRITTHVFLVARAFGAQEGILSGEEDSNVVQSIRKVVDLWGGDFQLRYEKDWKKFLNERKKEGWKIAHLTMYGENFESVAKAVEKCVVVVGSTKVPPEMYEIADWNLAVTNQPHSEVAALALFLDRVYGGKELGFEFKGKLRVIPSKKGKCVVEQEGVH
ncbi:MAG: tRNA (cytidine(56)-2'-O)-methyltransferase [Candidatus Micrarchaeota archaeon]|nr:tRNA (cytidine(56)-2'-O)-methyltransferase [Candidatus Micrarchaeota archaeon]